MDRAAWLTVTSLVCSLAQIPAQAADEPAAAAAARVFDRDVAPLFVNHCLECHHAGKASGKLNLATAAGIQKGGESGSPIVPGKPAESLLIERVTAGEMPPPKEAKSRPLSPAQIDVLRTWVAGGAVWPAGRELGLHEKQIDIAQAREFWSFQPVRRPAVPAVKQGNKPTDSRRWASANPIDAFLWEQRAKAGVEMAAPAAPRDLLRRASLDLIGLPPTLAEQERFLTDPAPDAYEQLVDRLLAHPGYGERWARHWLDLVRYADSNGYERDGGKPGVWRYRDYVIDSLNSDKPYDRFLLEQLAGDELPDSTAETLIATGFHALGTWQDEVDPLEAAQYRADELDDMIRTTAQTFLGVTIGCARCHNHKFDPLTMVDYYSLAAILSPLKRPNAGRTDRDFPAGSRAQLVALKDRDAKIAELNRQIDAVRTAAQTEWLALGKSQLPAEVVAAFRTPPGEQHPEQKQLVQKHAVALKDEVAAALPEAGRHQIADYEQALRRLRKETPDLPRAYYLFEETAQPAPTFLLLSGRASNPGAEMPPRVPAVLTEAQPRFLTPEGTSSGRRLTFARWVAGAENPLTARVIVNRVWQHHFGTGLVATPSDFGHLGARPTHPQLLDWLADWFTHDAQWSLKKLHRLIMTSEAYRTSGTWNARDSQRDPENKLLWRFPYRRLDVETIRDSMLAVSGKLNPAMHGPAVFLPIPPAVVEAHTDKQSAWKVSPEPDIYRRTVYAYVKRTLLVPMLEVLDLCDTTQSTDKRAITSIAPQALTLFNGEFVSQQAAFFAQRLIDETGEDIDRQIERAFLLALCRPPSAGELQTLRRFLETESRKYRDEQPNAPQVTETESHRYALIQMCRVILNLNEFVYPN